MISSMGLPCEAIAEAVMGDFHVPYGACVCDMIVVEGKEALGLSSVVLVLVVREIVSGRGPGKVMCLILTAL